MGAYGKFDLEYVRTDRNGTKIYLDKNCPRCAGYGESDNWAATGKVCYECGGSGLRRKPKTVKIYTQEHEALLEARRLERENKRLAENPPPSQEQLENAALEARRNTWENEGLSRDGLGYAYFGDTYSFKEKFKKAGAKWNTFLKGWVAPKSPSEIGLGIKGSGIYCVEISAKEYANIYGVLDMDKMSVLREVGGLV